MEQIPEEVGARLGEKLKDVNSEEKREKNILSDTNSDVTSFLDPKVAKHFRRDQIMRSLDYSIKAWILISIVSSAVHHIN